MARMLNIACVQFTAVDGEKEATVRTAVRLIEEAAGRGAALVVLPEVWTGLGYSTPSAYKEIAEPIPGPTTDRLGRIARQYGLHIVGSIYEDAGQGVYHNTAPLIGPDGGIVGLYRKTHLFDAPNRPDIKPGMQESAKVRAGDSLPVFDTAIGRIGVSVCSDLRFPEIYRVLALQGAEVIVCASAFLSPRFDHWEFFLRARACENQVFVAASGQVGTEPRSGIGFVGRSMIVDPWGTIVSTASDTETVTSAEIDVDFIDEVKRRYPLMEQRRPALYGPIADLVGMERVRARN
ncbi:MAG: carbon-nitrogen hydrolase family protein [Alphaproteobacteria bacterium]|nr:carbon-nitrogen hydrolase family protein [Alphaproteobacteria bacterium]